jgi:putative membrane protein
MFFVSYDEKYVEIIADKEISKKIDDEYWQVIVKEFIKDVKNNNLSNGYVKAIKSCSEILVKNFPIQTDDENELSNEVIELKP